MARIEQKEYTIKPLAEMLDQWNAPDWAYGCEKCDKGLIGGFTQPPTQDRAGFPYRGPFYMQKLAAYWDGELRFCDCKAGEMTLQWCRNASKHERRSE